MSFGGISRLSRERYIMKETIKITKKLQFDFDLMLTVDFEHEFTLRDLLKAVYNSKIPDDSLIRILRCPYIYDYFIESESKPFENDSDIEYLEVYYCVIKDTFEGKREDGSCWGFHGVGKEGVVPQDLIENSSEEEVNKMIEEGYRQTFAVEFSPMYKLADYPIRLGKEICFTDYDAKPEDMLDRNIDVSPSITLMELLYWVFWELSFLGSPKRREEQGEELKRRCDDVKSGKAKMIPWETVKKQLQDKFLKK